jgi:hypothetical protein
MADLPPWPATLPDPRASGYGIQPVTPYARTDMDNGAARQRRRFTSLPSHVSVTWRFTHTQHAIFEGFLAYEINLGTDWFAVGLLNGMGVNQVRARFMEDPPYKSAISDSRAWFDVRCRCHRVMSMRFCACTRQKKLPRWVTRFMRLFT